MAIDEDVLKAVRAVFGESRTGRVTLGAPLHEGICHPEPLIALTTAMVNRHGLIAGATGTGKTKTLQLIAEQLSAAGIPVFLADVKGDVAGIAVPGTTNPKVEKRSQQTGHAWKPAGYPVEFLSLSGRKGAQLRATVSSFGPMALAKVLDLNETQTSVLSLVFKYCDDKKLPLLDFADLRTVLQYLTGDGASELASYGGISKQSVGVLLREMIELEQQGAGTFFGEPEFELDDLIEVGPDGRGRVSVLALSDVQDKPALFSTFMMWMLARLYYTLPEVGDIDKPRLVFFFDEAHLLFTGASKAFVEQVEQVVRLIRSKGVGIFFITQSPKDVPANILGQLGNRIQHALRAFTPDDDKVLTAAARTFPKTKFYDVRETLTTLGIGEALVTVLSESGAPTPPFVCRMVAPSSRMGTLTPEELAPHLRSPQVLRYATPIDRASAHELLSRRITGAEDEADETGAAVEADADGEMGEPPPSETGRRGERGGREARRDGDEPSGIEDFLNSPIARTIGKEVTRGLMGAIFGPARRPRRRRSSPGLW